MISFMSELNWENMYSSLFRVSFLRKPTIKLFRELTESLCPGDLNLMMKYAVAD